MASKKRMTDDEKKREKNVRLSVWLLKSLFLEDVPQPFSSLLSRIAIVSLLSETAWAFRMSALIPRNFGDDINRPS